MASTIDVASLNITFCPAPFLKDSDFPHAGGYLPGRYCGKLTGDLSCCLPCPVEKLVYTDRFNSLMQASHWLNIPSLALQCLLLLTFIVLPKEVSHGSYHNFGLCIAIILLQLGFLIPLGTKPDLCRDTITPNDMYSDMSCAWTGALVTSGAMACASWVMLRSLYTHLKICWDFKHERLFFWVAEIVGWGLPGVFLALTLPITGVSYRLGPTCVPNQKNSFVTWFGWLIAFGCVAALLTSSTTVFCLWVYLKDLGREKHRGGKSLGNNGMGHEEEEEEEEDVAPNTQSGWTSRNRTRKLAWSRVKVVLLAQWRSVLLSTLVIVMVLYYGTVFVKQTNTGLDAVDPDKQAEVTTWAICIVVNSGDKTQCEPLSHVLGLDENAVIAAWFIAGLVGTFTFLLMVRRSMTTGWWSFIRHPRQWKRTESVGGQDFFIVGGDHGHHNHNHDHDDADHEPITKRISYSRQLGSDKLQSQRRDDDNHGDDDDDDGDDTSIEEIQPMPHHHHHHAATGSSTPQMYEMQHVISPVSPIPPILAGSPFGSSTAVNETHAAATSRLHAPGTLPASSRSGGGNTPNQARWSDSTSGTPSFSSTPAMFEAGHVSRRHETTNLFLSDERERPRQYEVGSARTTNRRVEEMI